MAKPTCEVDRHDNDHVEVKLGFHDPTDYNVDIYFFAPSTLGLSTSNPKTEFLNSMKSFVRLQTAPSLLDSNELVSAERVMLEAQRLSDVVQNEAVEISAITYAVKNTAVAYESYLKTRAKIHSKEDGKEVSPEKIEQLNIELVQTERINTRLRYILSQVLSSKREVPLPLGSRPGLVRLGEYVSYLMVDYLACFAQRVRRLIDFAAEKNPELDKLLNELDQLAHSELALRKKIGLHVDPDASLEAKEEYLYKTGLLKKYFQKVLFIQVKSIPMAQRVFQPMAAAAAGLAAVWAGLFQQAQSSSSFVSSLGLTPTWILTIGVMAYIVKDRIKDVTRHFLVGRVEKVLPDLERVLMYDGDAMKSCELGRIRETIKSIQVSELASSVYEARYSNDNAGLEAELGEDVIHYSKKIMMNKKSKGLVEGQWGLREIIRFSLGHYFQNLDDPFKEVSFIDDAGKLCRHETHRVYYAHLVFCVSYKQNGQLCQDVQTAKLVLDKQGLVKVSRSFTDTTSTYMENSSTISM